MTRLLGVALALLLAGCLPFGEECQAGQTKCENNVATYCPDDYAWHRTPCGTMHCIDDGRQPFCALSTEPDSACDDRYAGGACAGSKAIRCNGRYRIAESECGDPSLCIRHDLCDNGYVQGSFCATAATPDPRCGTGEVGWCDGDIAMNCECGLPIPAVSCSPQHCITEAVSTTRVRAKCAP